ncbi:hypothetical protein Bca4012_070102 [Brassica carinata]
MDLDRSKTKSPEELISIGWINNQASANKLITSYFSTASLCYSFVERKRLHHDVCLRMCGVRGEGRGIFFCIDYGPESLSETGATSMEHSLPNTIFHFTVGKR